MTSPGQNPLTDHGVFARSAYSQGNLYPPPPYRYRDAESVTLVYKSESEPAREFLPDGVEICGDEATILVVASSYPRTSFGAYSEIYFAVAVEFDGARYMFSPVMYADNDLAIAAGRELWGFAKKSAAMTMDCTEGQWTFTMTRHTLPLVHLSVACDDIRLPEIASTVSFPTLTERFFPESGRSGLVVTRNQKVTHIDSLGDPDVWSGRAAIAFPGGSASDPLEAFSPIEKCVGWYSRYDCSLPSGVVIRDSIVRP